MVGGKVGDGVVVAAVAVNIGVAFAVAVGGALVVVICMGLGAMIDVGCFGGIGVSSIALPLYILSPVRHVVVVASFPHPI